MNPDQVRALAKASTGVFTEVMTNTDERQVLDEVTGRLRIKFPKAPEGSIRSKVDAIHHQYDGRPIRDFIPVLVEREVADELRVSTGG